MNLPVIQCGLVLLVAASAGAEPVAEDPADPSKVVIIKADDFRSPNQAWADFLRVSREEGVKVGLGVIVSSIEGKKDVARWMREQQAAGDVEFWDHGWDHARWTTNGITISEFGGSGLEHMQKHMADSQSVLKDILGQDVMTFGTPYNAFDEDCASVINETPAVRLFFTRKLSLARGLLDARVALVDIIGEADGTGMPNAAKFEAAFPPGTPGPVSLQFHPANSRFDADRLDEYRKIVKYLIAGGYTILLPSGYVAQLPRLTAAE